jgi:hypothetical protein
MRAGGGKAKGSSFEREICRRLSLWVSKEKRVDLFWRSAMSGGRATVRRKQGQDIRQAGDICSVSPEGHALTDQYYIETKSYRALQIDRFILINSGTLARFWKKTREEADKYYKEPMLIAKQNGLPIIVVMDHNKWAYRWIETGHGLIIKLDDLLEQEFY